MAYSCIFHITKIDSCTGITEFVPFYMKQRLLFKLRHFMINCDCSGNYINSKIYIAIYKWDVNKLISNIGWNAIAETIEIC